MRCLLHRAQSEMDISYIFTHDPLWAVTHTAWLCAAPKGMIFEPFWSEIGIDFGHFGLK